MNRVAAIVVISLAGSSTVLAAGSWGSLEDANVCSKNELGNRNPWPKCQAEVDKRTAACLSDPEMEKSLAAAGYVKGNKDVPAEAKKICTEAAFEQMRKQLEAGDVEKIELPKAGMHNPALEKAVAAAYQKDYSGKILKVVLDRWDDDPEKDALGRVTGKNLGANVVNKRPDGKCQLHYELWLQHGNGKSFSGPLSARGAGSATDTDILCSKVEAGAIAGTDKKKRK